jgi:glutathione synthase/RimK-type ligase-like ATP-grasp enzyme
MPSTDIVLLTDCRYVDPKDPGWYVRNILLEDALLAKALAHLGYRTKRISWDNPGFDWREARYAVFRTTWDYFDRIDEFRSWCLEAREQTRFINPASTIEWNMDKHYLGDLERRGIRITETVFIQKGEESSLEDIALEKGWQEMILKPAIAGAARHTYRFTPSDCHRLEPIFRDLISKEDMLLQPFQENIIQQGEVAHMIFGGTYSHSILKIAKPGDFRVQDDYGGTVHDYKASPEEIEFAEKAVAVCDPMPVYARVDVVRDNSGQLAVMELELIEPELWMRNCDTAATSFARALHNHISGGWER